jgi:hypothetical protein
MRALTILAAVALSLCAGTAGADEAKKVTLSQQAWASFESYRAWITSTGTGAFAVSEDGAGGAGAGCPANDCMSRSKAGSMAIAKCEEINPGRQCQIFARNQEVVLPYEIAP